MNKHVIHLLMYILDFLIMNSAFTPGVMISEWTVKVLKCSRLTCLEEIILAEI